MTHANFFSNLEKGDKSLYLRYGVTNDIVYISRPQGKAMRERVKRVRPKQHDAITENIKLVVLDMPIGLLQSHRDNPQKEEQKPDHHPAREQGEW